MRRPTDALDHAVGQLREIDWEDIDEVEQTCRAALDTLATDPVALRHRLTDLPNGSRSVDSRPVVIGVGEAGRRAAGR
jgi:hypothetical protein